MTDKRTQAKTLIMIITCIICNICYVHSLFHYILKNVYVWKILCFNDIKHINLTMLHTVYNFNLIWPTNEHKPKISLLISCIIHVKYVCIYFFFMIDQQIARHFVHYREYLYHPPSLLFFPLPSSLTPVDQRLTACTFWLYSY